MEEKKEYLILRYNEMSIPQLEHIIKQMYIELERNPDYDNEELNIAKQALEKKKKTVGRRKKQRPCLLGRYEHQIDIGEEF
jgi:hypothetical protein